MHLVRRRSSGHVRSALALLSLAACGGSAFQAGSADGGAGTDGQTPDGTVDGGIVVVGGDSAAPIDGSDATTGEGGGGEAGTTEGGTADVSAGDTGPGDSGAVESGTGEAGSGDGGTGDGGAAEAGTCVVGEVCVTAAPLGWTGPVQFYYGSSAAPACPLFTTTGFTGGTALSVPQATCSTCTCSGAPACSTTHLSFYENDSTCTGSPCLDVPAVGSACTGMSYACGSGTTTSVYATLESTPSSTGCTPSGQAPTLPPTSWTDHAQECSPAPAADSCGTGNVCTPAPPGSFKECVYQSGDVACPAASGPYSVKQLVDTTVSDGRSCSGCSCGLSTGTSCTGGVVRYSLLADCSSASNLHVPTACGLISAPATATEVYFEQTDASAPSPASCASGGGQPTGTAVPATPVTVCCGS